MSTLIDRVDQVSRARPKAILAVWLLVILIMAPLAMRETDHLIPGGFTAAGSQSSRAERLLEHDFPQLGDTRIAVLLYPRAHATATMLRSDIARVIRSLRGIPAVQLTSQARQAALFSTDLVGPTVLPLQVSGGERNAELIDEKLRAHLAVDSGQNHNIEIHLLGEGALWTGLHETERRDLANAEKIGFPVVLVVLLLIFGSLSAAALPVLLGIGSVVVTAALIYALSLIANLSVFITNTASLVGIGVAIDYSLIILVRVRQELRAGNDLDQARAIALATSGRTVIYSGATVTASLIGLWVIPDTPLRSMALGAIVAVVVSVLMAVTLLPAVITVFGERRIGANVFVARFLRRGRGGRKPVRLSWERWTGAVVGHPILALTVVGTFLMVLCLPTLSMRTSTGALQQFAVGDEARVGVHEAASIQGAGALGPIYVIADTGNSATRRHNEARFEELQAAAERLPNVKHVGLITTSANQAYAVFPVVPNVDPESAIAKHIVVKLRNLSLSIATGTHVVVGGVSATQLDKERVIAAGMWKAFLAVLAVSFIILALLLRSLVLPFMAVAMNLLSVGAAYGILVVVFQSGWSDGIFNYHALGHLEVLTPPLILAIVFGLSMDYEIFLLSRIREHWLDSADSAGAVAGGLAASAGAISSAALILVCVFAVFVGTGVASIKEVGLGGAIAIGIDATLVRLVMVPALITLLGRWNWWWPPRLERVLGAKALLDRASA
jgi:uncharacterized membrane protein YdfJ with MMPL/SSD domain